MIMKYNLTFITPFFLSFNYILRHEARSLMGTSFYNLVHPADLDVVVVSIREMLTKGHTRTPYYRLIGLNKSVLWVQTEATSVNHTAKGQKGQYIICVHQLIGLVFSIFQYLSFKFLHFFVSVENL